MNLTNKLLTIILILLISQNAFGWRMARPITLTHPLDERQVRRLNDILTDIWNATNGRINLDIVTTTKSGPDEGDLWILNDSGTYKLEFRAGGSTRTITP